MLRIPTPFVLPAFVLALWPAPSPAQEGPSFNCRYARTATEHTICGSAELSRLELEMHGAYLGLVDAVGQRQARRIADRFLERRQTCGAEEACIAERLVITQRVFERRAGTPADSPQDQRTVLSTERISAPPPRPESLLEHGPAPDEPEAASLPERTDEAPEVVPEDFAAAPSPAPEPSIDDVVAAAPETRLAAQTPLPSDPGSALQDSPAQVATATPDLTEPPSSSELIAEAELTSAVEPAPFDTPVSWAFMDLIRHQRAVIQERLKAAGHYDGRADGTWDRATLDGLQAFLASETGRNFDASTEGGATLALDYIRSAAFAQTHGVTTASEAAAPGDDDPLASTDW